jgi:hypothetical protein
MQGKETAGTPRRYDRPVRGRSLVLLTPALPCMAFMCACSSSTPPPSLACVESPQAVEAALAGAPGRVRLRDGTRLSQCVSHASDQGSLETIGATFVTAAGDLEARARRDRAAALELGYLIGAVRRGASTTNGVGLELARRLESAGALAGAGDQTLRAEHEGLVAGQRDG